MLTFYALFESTLIPMFLLILFWGARQRKLHAAYMFFFYTAFGSIFLLSGVLIYFANSGSVLSSFVIRIEPEVTLYIVAMWFCLFIGFGFKVPVVPVHT
jgi:NADH:ubiquinone oxidoreductase subunit 4 (subunit M)